jgi:hypothetical protein
MLWEENDYEHCRRFYWMWIHSLLHSNYVSFIETGAVEAAIQKRQPVLKVNQKKFIDTINRVILWLSWMKWIHILMFKFTWWIYPRLWKNHVNNMFSYFPITILTDLSSLDNFQVFKNIFCSYFNTSSVNTSCAFQSKLNLYFAF